MKKVSVGRPIRTGLALAVLGVTFGGSAFAAEIAPSPNPASVGIGSSTEIAITFTGDGATTAFSGALEYDTTVFDASSDNAVCTINDAFDATTGRIIVVAFGLNPLPDQTFCNITLTETTGVEATAAGSPYALSWFEPVFGGSGGGDVATDGAVNVQVAPPDVNLVYDPASGGIVNFGAGTSGDTVSASIDISTTGSIGGGSVDSCVLGGANAGAFTIDSAFPIAVAAGGAGTIDVSCTLGNEDATATLTCQETDVSPSSPSWTLDCAAGTPVPAPEYSSAPAAGSQLSCSGQPDSMTSTQVTITNDGFAGVGSDLDYTCSVAGAGFALGAGGAGTLAVGDSAVVTVSCTVPSEGSPDATGTLTCTSNDADEPSNAYPLVAGVVTTPPPVPGAAIIPANSLWSKLALFGLLAGLGALVISLRRN